ncbi:DUF4230 domain-containing protein [Xylanibacter ruminicola]|uniref:DUF4230 domain-containing protein n=1 Tax=Xylanibacter ruminicola TaxID=839 RepID=A0A1M6RC29_XYLRU|nr:DUF4230 domain-containing protein [Xylanibacter ruminicola]SHK30013.1 Protein of unknown function [Xylanibacter ruminicola]
MNRKRLILLACGIVLLLIIILLLTVRCEGNSKQEPAPTTLAQGIDTVPMLITQVQKCSKLYTAEYRVHKIITHDDALRLKGQLMSKAFDLKVPLADRKIAIPMDAKIKAYIDFSEFSEKNIERSGDKITIILPDPQIVMTSSKIDQKNMKQYVGLTRAHFSDEELASYQQQGREAIIKSIPDMGITETAQANAAKVLVPMMKQLGYEEQNITIAFRKQYSPQDWNALIKLND